MGKTNAETMTVRLPTQVANALIKLRNEKNLPTIGSALQIYIQKMLNDEIHEKMDDLSRSIKNIAKALEYRGKVLEKTCGAIHVILGGKNSICKDLRKLGCEKPDECPMKDYPGLVDFVDFKSRPRGRSKVKTKEHIS